MNQTYRILAVIFLIALGISLAEAFSKKQSSSTSSQQNPSSSTPAKSIDEIVNASACAKYSWPSRGIAPRGFVKGLARVYAKQACDLIRLDPVALQIAAENGSPANDTLAHYGITRATKADRLRAVFAFMVGFGMRESSGKHCEGKDASASNTTASTCEAGLYQTSYNSVSGSLRQNLYKSYKASKKNCYLEVFSEGVSCSSANWKNWGSGEGVTFQKLSKECPTFAVELAAVNARVLRKHYGPINRKEVTFYPACEQMFREIDKVLSCN